MRRTGERAVPYGDVEHFPELLLHEADSPAGVIAFATDARNPLGCGCMVHHGSTDAGRTRTEHPSIMLRRHGISGA